ncbi:calmodulin-like protein 3 [Physcomitrium patens]|uniref:EF-hand domain-containing protein n=1 Tax=Physcomitrium patens TaxID=3218 RepID=A0A2K1KTG6_PHYPA|nr:calmodulin-like protein 7 [Physcomitrium patens]PNR57061.1 hypothetical protein PHYPA_004054 [Physcomitrium patens]|eukprot:XP_024369922.1 calmodulin-like protein 7 [Physcomitrella patens]
MEVGNTKMSQDLTASAVKDLEDVFKMLDRNGDGKISKTELGAVLGSLGEILTDPELEQMIREVDVDGDGGIDLQEFIKLNAECVDAKRLTAEGEADSHIEEALQSAFNVFDSDNDGFISAGELHRVLSSLGDDNISLDDCRYMISCVDADGDQLVDFKEFRKLMNGHVTQ